jgi:hypothetical protein
VDAGRRDQVLHPPGVGVGEVLDLDVRHARVPPLGLAPGPAHQLDAAVAGVGGEADDFFQ